MQLAAITDEISQEFEYALDVMLEYGAFGAELRGLWGTNIADLTDSQAERAKVALKSRGMSVCSLATPFFKCDLEVGRPNPGEAAGRMHLATPRGMDQQMEMLRRCIELAHFFETDLIRVFSFWRKSAYTPEIEARIVELLSDAAEIAGKEGIVLGLENEHACYIGTGEEVGRVAKAVNSPFLKVVWDPGNALSAGEEPFPLGYEACKPWLKHVHIKDGVLVNTKDHGEQLSWCVVGEGVIDYIGQFNALRKDNYTGFISLETHYIPKQGSGVEGEGTAEDGSRPCLDALRNFLGN